jgi:hypothetical protein
VTTNPNPDRRARYAAAIAEGFRAFDADTTSDAHLDADLLDAVVAAADAEVAELLAAVSVVPPATNQTARCGVCQRVEDGSHPAVCFPPAPVDRAAALAEAATRYEEILAKADTGQDPRYWTAVRDITLGLRAMAAELPAVAEPESGCAHCGGLHAWDDCEAYTALVAAEAPHTATPAARAVAYSDGKGRAYCLACPRPFAATVPLTIEDVDPCETCWACERPLVDVARDEQPQ